MPKPDTNKFSRLPTPQPNQNKSVHVSLSLPYVRSYEYRGSGAHGPTLKELISGKAIIVLAITVDIYT